MAVWPLFSLIVLGGAVVFVSWHQLNTCSLQVNRFSSKTAYRNHRLRHHSSTSDLDSCHVVHVSGLYRHGSRHPSEKHLLQADKLHIKLSQSAHGNRQLYSSLEEWSQRKVKLDDARALTYVGEEELYQLGANIRKHYGYRLLGANGFSRENSHFISSEKERSIMSGVFFIKGLLKSEESPETKETPKEWMEKRNDLMRFFDFCSRYTTSVDKNKTAVQEFTAFRAGPEMKAVLQSLVQRFNLSDADLSTEDVQILYTLCAFDIANNATKSIMDSPWCQLFTDADAAVIEYLLDLKHYWAKSYGHEVNYLQAWPYIDALITRMKTALATDTNNPPRGFFSFGHAETVLPVLTHLGLFNQTLPLLSTNYDIIKSLDTSQRTFQTSNLSPFGANIVLLLYSCQHKEDTNVAELRVQPLVNERSVYWPLCGHTHCSWKQFLDTFSPETSKFDYPDYCANN